MSSSHSTPVKKTLSDNGRRVVTSYTSLDNDEFNVDMYYQDVLNGRKIVSPVKGNATTMHPDDVQLAVSKCRNAQKDWEKTTFEGRKEVLMMLINVILHRKDDIVKACSPNDNGKPSFEVFLDEIMTTVVRARFIVEGGENALREHCRNRFDSMSDKIRTMYVPMGVIGLIIPSRAPFFDLLSNIMVALYAGNGVCVKVSEWSGWTTPLFRSIVHRVLRDFGCSVNLVQFITGFAESGSALVESGVDKIIFVGSEEVGMRVMETAAKNLTPVDLDVRKTETIVVADNHRIDEVVEIVLGKIFTNCGYNYKTVKRVYVHRTIYLEFVDKIGTRASNLYNTKKLVGVVTNPERVHRTKELIDDAVRCGAQCSTNGRDIKNYTFGLKKDPMSGIGIGPSILIHCNDDMEIIKEGFAGPILYITKFEADEDIEGLTSDTEEGLSGIVYCEDVSRGEKIANLINARTTALNFYTMPDVYRSGETSSVMRIENFLVHDITERLRNLSKKRVIVTPFHQDHSTRRDGIISEQRETDTVSVKREETQTNSPSALPERRQSSRSTGKASAAIPEVQEESKNNSLSAPERRQSSRSTGKASAAIPEEKVESKNNSPSPPERRQSSRNTGKASAANPEEQVESKNNSLSSPERRQSSRNTGKASAVIPEVQEESKNNSLSAPPRPDGHSNYPMVLWTPLIIEKRPTVTKRNEEFTERCLNSEMSQLAIIGRERSSITHLTEVGDDFGDGFDNDDFSDVNLNTPTNDQENDDSCAIDVRELSGPAHTLLQWAYGSIKSALDIHSVVKIFRRRQAEDNETQTEENFETQASDYDYDMV